MEFFNILLVDDEKDLLDNLEYDLKELSNYINVENQTQVRVILDTAQSGNEALQKLKSSQYDCLITDINLPELNGIELAKGSKNLGLDLPIIFLTAHGTQETFEKIGDSVTILDLLNKPYHKEELFYLLNEAYCEVEDRNSKPAIRKTG